MGTGHTSAPAARRSSSSGPPRLGVEADDDAGSDAEAGHGQPAVGHPATEAPAARIASRDIPRRGPDHDDVGSLLRHPSPPAVASRPGRARSWSRRLRASGRLAGKPILASVALRDGDAPVFFYELHESDADIFADLLLAHETEYDEAEFLELVLESRARVIESFARSRSSRPSPPTSPHGRISPRHRRFAAARGGERLVSRGRHVRLGYRHDRPERLRQPGLPHAARGRRARRCRVG